VRPHLANGSRSLLRLDVESAYETIRTKHVAHYLTKLVWRNNRDKPFLVFSADEAWIIARLVTYKGKLRRGSPFAPLLFNMLWKRMDTLLAEIARSYPGVVYTRYGDDMHFSSREEFFPREVEEHIRSALRLYAVKLKHQKTRRDSRGNLEFCGAMVIDGRVLPLREYIERTTEIPSMTQTVRKGHLAFLKMFGYRGSNLPKKLRHLYW
jgi:hypothetical protein